MYYNPNDLLIAGTSLLILYILYDTMDDYLLHTDFLTCNDSYMP